MNINANSRFSQVPQVMAQRSKFDLSHSVKTSFNVGELVPFYYEEVLPGDTFSIDTNCLCRLQPLVAPIMSDLFLDIFYFYIPNRLVWTHWKDFMGENTQGAWYPTTEYNVPHYKMDGGAPGTTLSVGSLADYFGIPVGMRDTDLPQNYVYPKGSFSKLPIRAYQLIWNEWFRDQNLQDPVLIDLGDGDSYVDITCRQGPYKVNKYHDYYTSSLPEPQKGPDVILPIDGIAPVYSLTTPHDYRPSNANGSYLHFYEGEDAGNFPKQLYVDNDTGNLAFAETGGQTDSEFSYLTPDNLWAMLDNSGGGLAGSTINALRLAMATQSFYEKNARGGTRYRELIKSHFNVTSPDGRQQVPELLSYNRVDVNINQVVQNSSSVEDSPIGRQAAYSLTADSDNSFTKSFTEHGMILGLCCLRYHHSYQQGLNKRFSRRTLFDYYFPVFANLGEQPVLNKEIFMSNDAEYNEGVFGYQEAYADYRYHPDIVTGEMRSGHSKSLDVWHLADYFKNYVYLSPEFIQEDKTNLDRCLAVTSDVSNQVFADFYIKNDAVRVMPMYSIPGLPRTL